MPQLKLSLQEDVSDKSKKAKRSFGDFVTSVNQGLQLVQDVGGKAYRALDSVFEQAGKSKQLRTGFENLSGGAQEAEENLNAITEAMHGTVSEMEAMEIANTALSFGIADSSEDLGELAQIGSVLAQSLGQDASKGVADLTLALSRSSPMILDNLGISLKLSDAYAGEAERLGKLVKEMTDAEKKQAFLNEALKLGREKVETLGGFVESSATSWLQFKANLADTRVEVSEALAEELADLAEWFAGTTGDAVEWGKVIRGVRPVLEELGAEVENVGERFEDGGLLSRYWTYEMERAKGMWAALTGAVGDAVEVYEEAGAAIEELAEEQAEAAASSARAAAQIASGLDSASDSAAGLTKPLNKTRIELEHLADASTDLFVDSDGVWTNYAAKVEQANVEQIKVAKGLGDIRNIGGNTWTNIGRSAAGAAEGTGLSWMGELRKIKSAFVDLKVTVVGESTQMIDTLQEEFGEMFTAEDLEIATWIDEGMADALARQEEIMGPMGDALEGEVTDGISDGMAAGFDDADIDGFGKDLNREVRVSVADAMKDPDLARQLAAAFGIAIGQTIGDTAVGGGRKRTDLSKRDQAKLDKVLEAGQFKAIVAQGMKGAMNAIETGDFLALKRIHDGALNNARFAKRESPVQSREFIAANQQLADQVAQLARIFDIDVPGFAEGGVFDFGKESLAKLHGREAIVPLESGGDQIATAILGGNVYERLGELILATMAQTEALADRLDLVAVSAQGDDAPRVLSIAEARRNDRKGRSLRMNIHPSEAVN